MEQRPVATENENGDSACSKAPSSLLTAFDVNKFLKKTFSDYDIDRHNAVDPSINRLEQLQSQKGQDGREASTADKEHRPIRKKTAQRRAGSVPAGGNEIAKENLEANGVIDDEPRDTDKTVSVRRSRTRSRPAADYSRCFCAYCGTEIVNQSSSSTSRSGLYCATCTNFFTRHSPSELQRFIAYDEMTRPSLVTPHIPNVEVGTSSTAVDEGEISPLLSDSNLNKIALVSNCGGGNEDNLSRRQRRQRQHDEEDVVDRRYKRHDQRLGRSHAKPKPVPLLPCRQKEQHLRPDGIEQGGDSSKSNSLLGESGNRNRDDFGNNGNSRRSSFASASSTNRPTCRICHLYGEPGETLVSPCRCAGTMQYVHTACLVHWLEISAKRVLPTPHCELCGYHYRTHHCYKFRRVHTPSCNHRDRVLHVVFVIMLIVMIGCAALSAVYLRQDKGAGQKRVALTSDDIAVIASALLFFCAFFVAVFTQYRAETSVCGLCIRFWLINRHWRVKDYDRNLDFERHAKLGRSSVIEQV